MELMTAVDDYIPQPERPKDLPFLMPIEDVFSISGRGTVVTGRIERGVVNVGDNIEIVGIKDTSTTVVTGVEMFRKLLDSGEAGDNVGCLPVALTVKRLSAAVRAQVCYAARSSGRGLYAGKEGVVLRVLHEVPSAVC